MAVSRCTIHSTSDKSPIGVERVARFAEDSALGTLCGTFGVRTA